ncbi:hypothetical protein IU500_33795 [Nocardia terpenica]|nr:hypothetical protein [Nocardia terpenica]MBF6066334.1 hypothetical protein [Nocardia terpenica]MBF6108993.1 hypothetical protein [Nocardia terpenica]MBF6116581.1 hypothetical protein [Nocardia terpenica]MBF6121837.1 hypothetical protein [Nocardia terpenica]MBF6155619.1 hypothetical protein [Nocardia terpenica]
MKKLGTFVLTAAAVGGAVLAAIGPAAADDHITLVPENPATAQPVVAVGEHDPNGTGSSQALTGLTKALSSGSGGKATPAQ